MRPFALTLAIVPALIVAAPATPRAATAEEEVEAVLRTWAELFAERGEGAADRIAALYAPDARFWGVASLRQIVGREAVRTYYFRTGEGMRSRSVEWGERAVRVYGSAAVASGRNDYHRVRANGEPGSGPARFSMTLIRQADGSWLIVDHHSSALPEQAPTQR
ncbi:SgcJ/EcaC family oxidoreductase [Dankookia rubra]|uniref:SgcJ/EcaC family oxidoreductase n=1 Tax=Dankookia rubra TaxID=1442381 RepID=A0A4R5Q688_9PROT|nr:SgcJ/EcaC family oxidoreductase [Dankookia rubra]TDH58392.1 SgcJ/EcaC family oxidoreductase [Dankookia rubra]